MKISNAIAVTTAAFVASTAMADITTYTSQANWNTAANALTGEYTDPGSFVAGSNVGGVAAVYSGGWENFTVTAGSGGTAVWNANTSIVLTAAAGALTSFTFNFYDAPSGGSSGIWGFYMAFNPAMTGSGTSFNLAANGTPFNGVGPFTTFLGWVADQPAGATFPNAPVTTFTLGVSAGQTVTITGFGFAIVPAPGAVALLGVAGLVGSRRRRA